METIYYKAYKRVMINRELNLEEKMMLNILFTIDEEVGAVCAYPYEYWKRILSCSKSKVKKTIKSLEDKGLIVCEINENPDEANEYYITKRALVFTD